MKTKTREILLRISGMLFIMESIEDEYHKDLLKPVIEGIKYVLEYDNIIPSNELRNKNVDPKRMELSGNCPHCNNHILFLLNENLNTEKLWSCSQCKKEFKIGEY